MLQIFLIKKLNPGRECLKSAAYFFDELVLTEIKPSRFHPLNFNIRLIINKTWKVCGFKGMNKFQGLI
jgi:hypothetical protein